MYSKQLETFVKTADAGSFTKAARQLYISPASLIQQVNTLEARLGVALFVRGPRGVRLTEAGESMYRDACDIMQRSQAAVRRARNIQARGEGGIRVGTSLLTKCRLLPTFWAHMIERDPSVRIELASLGYPGETLEHPLSELGVSYDLQEGLYLSECYEGRCQFLELKRCDLVPATPASHVLASRESLSLDDFEGMTVVMLERGVSAHFDKLRDALEAVSDVKIVDVPFYDMNVFSMCEIRGYVLMTPAIWEDIHPALKVHEWKLARAGADGGRGVNANGSVCADADVNGGRRAGADGCGEPDADASIREAAFCCPYGIIYAEDPTPQVARFLDVIGEVAAGRAGMRA